MDKIDRNPSSSVNNPKPRKGMACFKRSCVIGKILVDIRANPYENKNTL
jgi:hypothetical protein